MGDSFKSLDLKRKDSNMWKDMTSIVLPEYEQLMDAPVLQLFHRCKRWSLKDMKDCQPHQFWDAFMVMKSAEGATESLVHR